MKNKQRFVFVESNTTGTGELLIHKAIAKGWTPIFITKNPKKYAFLLSDNVEVVLLNTSDQNILFEYVSKIKGLIGIYSSSENYIEIASWLAEQVGLPGSQSQAIKVARNKYLCYQKLIASGIATPKTESVFDIVQAKDILKITSLPVIIKPIAGTGSVGVKLCANEDECLVQINLLMQEENSGVLIQEYIDGPEFSVEVCSVSDSNQIIGITKKYLSAPPYFIEIGHDFPAVLAKEDEQKIKEVVPNLLTVLGLKFGFFHIELKIKNGKVYIIEVNPRLAGGMIPILIQKSTDVDILDFLLELYTNQHIEKQISYKKFSSIRHVILSKSGRIKSLNYSDSNSLDEIKILKSKGDLFVPQGDFRDRVAYVIVSDLDAEGCRMKADLALQKFEIEIESEDD